MNLNKKIPTPIAILIIVVIAVLVGSVFYWQYKQVEINISGLSSSECATDSDCEYLECPSRGGPDCILDSTVKSRCVEGKCKCKCECECEFPDSDLPESPLGDKLTYQGKIYVQTDQKYYEYILEKYQVELEEGVIYDYKGNVYALKAADPHHGSYIYTKWQLKPTDKEEVSNWKTYTNEEYKVKLDYPQEFQIEEEFVQSFDEFNWYRITFEDNKGTILTVEINPDGYGPVYSDRSFQIKENEDNKLVIEEIKKEEKSQFQELINFRTNLYEANNGNTYWIRYKAEKGSLEESLQLFKDILKSFYFIN